MTTIQEKIERLKSVTRGRYFTYIPTPSYENILEALSLAVEGLEKIGFTTDVAPADETGGPCKIHLGASRNRRILEAQDALKAINEKLGRG